MTRFMQELSGSLGEYWQREAKKELQKVREELEAGKITIDTAGVAYNCIGRVLMDDQAEKVSLVTDQIDMEATQAAREKEVAESVREYRASWKGYSEEMLAEMRAAFGPGQTVVNLFTGEKVTL